MYVMNTFVVFNLHRVTYSKALEPKNREKNTSESRDIPDPHQRDGERGWAGGGGRGTASICT